MRKMTASTAKVTLISLLLNPLKKASKWVVLSEKEIILMNHTPIHVRNNIN